MTTMPYREWLHMRRCTRKRRFASRSSAWSSAWRVALWRGLLTPTVRPIPCDDCGGWHLTGRGVR